MKLLPPRADSNGIIGASDDIVADGTQLSHFDSSASSDVLRRIRQLEDSSLDSFVGEIPSELKVGSSLLESVVEDSVDLRHQPQAIHHPVMNNTNSSSGVSSVPTSTVKPALIDVKLREDETSLSADPTSSFVTSEQQQVLTSRTSGLEEDTSGISGISPLDDPSSMDPIATMSGGIGGGEDVELADSQEWRKLKISFEPPTSTADRDVRGEQSFVL